MKNIKGFTLIELIMVTIILGILAAVAIPRYMVTIESTEEAIEDKIISSIKDGLEMYALEMFIKNGRRSWPINPFDALATKPTNYDDTNNDADTDDEWTFNTTTKRITHQRYDNTLYYWTYDSGMSHESSISFVGTGECFDNDANSIGETCGINYSACETLCQEDDNCESFMIDVVTGNGCCVIYSTTSSSQNLAGDCCECYNYQAGHDNNANTGTGIGERTLL